MSEPILPARILVASDGSGPADAAIKMAGDLANATHSELHLVHVTLVSRDFLPDLLSEAQVDRLKSEARDRLAAEETRAQSNGVSFAGTHLKFGRTDAEIITLAEELDVGMIVIGNRSGDAMSRILLGNDAESVVRHAHCAVLVVRL